MNPQMIWQGQTLELFAAAEEALTQIPPAFPLEATVAVNPWLGQVAEPREEAAARLERLGAGAMFLPRAQVAALIEAGKVTSEDLAAAALSQGLDPRGLAAAAAEGRDTARVLPTVADLAAEETGIDWPGFLEERFGHWAGAHFDRGQAFWPAPQVGAWTSWRAYASRDLTPGLAGLTGFSTAIAATPTSARTAFAEACAAMGVTPEAAPAYFHRLLLTLSGWAQYARHLSWVAERDGGRDDTLLALLTIRLHWDLALLRAGGEARAARWADVLAEYAAPVGVRDDARIDAALQEAVDRSGERWLAEAFAAPAVEAAPGRPALQAAFCIDVRSEPFRRALETADPDLRTLGFAGFFGLAVKHHAQASDILEARAPILLSPAAETRMPGGDEALRVGLRTVRAWGRFKRAAVSAFAFVEAAGPLYVGKLLRDALGLTKGAGVEPLPDLDLAPEARIEAAAGILRAMSLTRDFAPLVLLCGHGAGVTNAPHASALQCGACGGHAGDVNARLLAGLLNDGDVREGLAAKGIEIPIDTVFLAGLHDTVSDGVTLYDDLIPESHRAPLQRLKTALSRAGLAARTQRAARLPRGSAEALAARGRDWSELRPEWGLAGCRAFVAAPRARSAGRDLGGQVFLHDYDWRQDEGAGVLELILSAPVVVASWIALQYHGSTVAPQTFGAGNKLLHNVVGGIGVLEGNGGALRAGLPFQSVHDGEAPQHLASRLTVAVEAPEAMISGVLDRHPGVRALFDNGWLALVALDDDGQIARRYEGGGWVDRVAVQSAGPRIAVAA